MADELDPLGHPFISTDDTPSKNQGTSQPPKQDLDPLGHPFEPEQKKLSDTYKQVMDTDPEKNAKVQAIHSKTGDPPGFIANNLNAAEKASKAPKPYELDSMFGTHPIVADWLSNPDNLSLIHDHVPAMQKTESVWKDFEKGMASTGNSINSLFNNIAYNTGVIFGSNKWDFFHDNQEFYKEQINSIATPSGDKEWIRAIKDGDYEALGKKLVQQIPNMAMLSSLAPLGTATLAGIIGTQTKAEAYDESRRKGLAPEKALASSEFKGAVSGVTMMLPLGYFFRLFGPLAKELGGAGAKAVIKASASHWLQTSLGMSTQNTVQTLSNAIADKVSGEDPKAFEELGHKLIESAIGGFATGTVMSSVPIAGAALSKEKTLITPEEKATKQVEQDAQKAQSNKEAFLKLIEDAKAHPLAERSPEKFKEVLDKLQPGGPRDVHIPIEDWQTLHQEAKQDPEDAAKELGPDVLKSYQTANGSMEEPGTGGHVTVPLSDLIAKKASSGELEKLADHIKFDPTEKTVKEATEAKDENQRIVEAKTAQEKENEQALQTAQKELEKQITAVGGKKSMATGITKFFKTMAERTGLPVDRLLKGYKLNFFSNKAPSKAELYQQGVDMGGVSPLDYLEKHGIKLLVEKPDLTTLAGGAKHESQAKHESRKGDAKSSGVPWTESKDTKGAMSPAGIAQTLFEAANEGEVYRNSLPEEWWDEGKNGRPDAEHYTILEIMRNGGSVLEELQNQFQGERPEGALYKDPLELSPEKQKEIFGISKKESAVDKVFGKPVVGDMLAKPNLNAKQQEMFPGKAGGEQQTLFQSRLTPQDYGRFIRDQRVVEGMRAAVQDPKTGKTWTADRELEGHNAAQQQARFEGIKYLGQEHEGFVLTDGTFLTRKQAEWRYGVKVSSDLNPQTYYQTWNAKLRGEHRGEIHMAGTPGERTFNIYVNELSDKSTFFHEPAHAFFEIFHDLAARDDAPEELKADASKLLDWLKVKDWSEITDAHKEQFARGYEYRLWEGKVPVAGLRGIFDRFTQWLREVYPSAQLMEEYLLKGTGQKMTEEMRGVYDRMIATSKEIDEAQELMGYNKEAPKGATPEEIEMWKKAQGAAKSALFDKIIKEKMDELTPSAHQMQEEEREKATKEATEDVDKMPVFQADSYLKEHGLDSKEAAQRLLTGKGTSDDEMEFQEIGTRFLGTDEPLAAAKMMESIDREKEIQGRIDEHMAAFKPQVNAPPDAVRKSMYEGEAGEANSKLIALERSIVQTQMVIEKSLGEIKPQPAKQMNMEGKTEEPAQKPAVSSAKEEKPTKPPEEKAGEKLGKEFGKQLKKNLEELPEVKQLSAETMEAARKRNELNRAEAKSQAKQKLDDMEMGQAGNWKIHSTAERNAKSKADQAEKRKDYVAYDKYRSEQQLNHELTSQAGEAGKIITKSIRQIKGFSKLEKDPSRLTYGHWKIMKQLMEDYDFKKKTPENDKIQELRAQTLSERGVEDNQITDQTGMRREGQGWAKEKFTDFIKRMAETKPEIAARLDDRMPKPNAFGKMTYGQLKALRNNLSVIYYDAKLNQGYSEGLKNNREIKEEFGKQLKKNLEELPEVKQLRAETMEAARKRNELNRAEAKSQAKQKLDDMEMGQAGNWKIHSTAERNAKSKADQAEKRKDYVAYDKYKSEQQLNHELTSQAGEAGKIITKSIRQIKGFSKLEKDPSRLTYGHWKIMKQLMEDYDFKKKTPENDKIQELRAQTLSERGVEDNQITDQTGMRREGQGWAKEKFTDFIKRMAETKPEIAARLDDRMPKPNAFGKMTYGQLKALRNNLSVIYNDGRSDREIVIGGKKEKLIDFCAQTAKQIVDSVGKMYGANQATLTDIQKKISRFSAVLKNGASNLPINLSEITGLDKFIPNLSLGYDVKLNQGYSEGLKNNREIKEEFDGITNKHYSKEYIQSMSERSIPLKIGTSAKPELRSKWEILNIIRLQGSRTGYNRLTKGNRYSEADLKTINDSINEKDFHMIKDWAEFDKKMFGRMVDTEMRVHNYEPKGVDFKPVQTRFGILEGSYHPLKYDYEHPSLAGKTQPTEIDEKGQPLNPFLNKNMLKGRVENLPRAVRLDESVYLDHLNKVIKYLSWEEPLQDINKFINHSDVDDAIKAGFGGKPGEGQWLYHNMLDFALHGDPKLNWADDKLKKFLSATRTANILYHIAFRPHLYVVKAITDAALIAKEPGFGIGKWASYFLASHPFSMKYGDIRKEVGEQSEIMRSRHIAGLNFDTYSVNDIFKRYGETERAQKIGQSLMFWPEKLADRITDPMWKDIHDTLTSQGVDDKTAIALANDKIAKIFGSGEEIYRTFPMRGDEMYKQISPAYTIFGAILNRAITQGRIKYLLTPSEIKQKPVLNQFIRSKIIGTQMFYYASAIALAEQAGQLVYKHKEEWEKTKKEYHKIKDAVEQVNLKKSWDVAKDVMGTVALAGLKMIPGGQRISQSIEHPGMMEKVVSSVPSGEYVSDLLKSIHYTEQKIEGKHLTDKELHDMIGGYAEATRLFPERIDAMIIHLHEDMAKHQFSFWDLFSPIQGKTGSERGTRGNSGGR